MPNLSQRLNYTNRGELKLATLCNSHLYLILKARDPPFPLHGWTYFSTCCRFSPTWFPLLNEPQCLQLFNPVEIDFASRIQMRFAILVCVCITHTLGHFLIVGEQFSCPISNVTPRLLRAEKMQERMHDNNPGVSRRVHKHRVNTGSLYLSVIRCSGMTFIQSTNWSNIQESGRIGYTFRMLHPRAATTTGWLISPYSHPQRTTSGKYEFKHAVFLQGGAAD